MTKHDWNNDNTCRNLGSHNSLFQVKDIDWSEYYIYPGTHYNVRPDCFEFNSSKVTNIVSTYAPNKNALTYPLEYNLTLDKFPDGWGVQAFNEYTKIEELKYNIGNDIYCPVVLEPGTVVYGKPDSSEPYDWSINTTDHFTLAFRDNQLLWTTYDPQNQDSETINKAWNPSDFMDGHLPRRILVEVQGAGGTGGGGQNSWMTDGQSGGGGASGAYAAIILNLGRLYDQDNPKLYRYVFYIGDNGGDVGQESHGERGLQSFVMVQKKDYESQSWRYAISNSLIICWGGQGGCRGCHDNKQVYRASGGKIEIPYPHLLNSWFWILHQEDGKDGSMENGQPHSSDWEEGESWTEGSNTNWTPINTRDNDNHLAGSWFARHGFNSGNPHYKAGGGAASHFGGGADGYSATDTYGAGGGGGGGAWIGDGSNHTGHHGGTGRIIAYLPLKNNPD